MTQEQVNKIFDPFSQADSSTTRIYGGTGLGLSITKHFCELLDGKIETISTINKGTSFIITLPLRSLDKSADVNEETVNNIINLNDHTNTSS